MYLICNHDKSSTFCKFDLCPNTKVPLGLDERINVQSGDVMGIMTEGHTTGVDVTFSPDTPTMLYFYGLDLNEMRPSVGSLAFTDRLHYPYTFSMSVTYLPGMLNKVNASGFSHWC